MRLTLLLDKILRLAAIAAVLIAAPIVLLMSAFATDSGTAAAMSIGMGTLIVGAIIGVLVILASLRFRRAAVPGAPPPRNQSVLLTAVVYLVGSVGLLAIAYLGATQWRGGHRVRSIEASDANAPALNPQPQWILRIGGQLPAGVPLQYLEAHYVTDTAKESTQGICAATRGAIVEQMVLTRKIEVTRDAGRYQASVPVDQYQPGDCGWHLSTVDFKIDGSKRNFQPGQIDVYDPHFKMLGPIPERRQTRFDLWCGTSGCDTVASARPDLNDALPADQRNWSVSLWVYRDSPGAEVDFHRL